MLQHRGLVNLEAGRSCCFTLPSELLPSSEFSRSTFSGIKAKDLLYCFARPVRPTRGRYTPSNLADGYEDMVAREIEAGRSLLLSLPDEILLLILEQLERCSDAFCLALAAQRLFQLGWDHLGREMRRLYGSWAGCSIICIGSECKVNDIPRGILTDKEMQAFKKHEDCQIRLKLGGLSCLRQTWDLDMFYPPLMPHLARYFMRRQRLKYYASSAYWLSRSQRALAQRSLTVDFWKKDLSDYFPAAERWILRNLTSKEYVRDDELSDAFPGFNRFVWADMDDFCCPRFIDAIMSRSRCSSSSSLDSRLARFSLGPWMGHKFEICVEAEHNKDGETWVDVTQDVIKDLREIDKVERSLEE